MIPIGRWATRRTNALEADWPPGRPYQLARRFIAALRAQREQCSTKGDRMGLIGSWERAVIEKYTIKHHICVIWLNKT